MAAKYSSVIALACLAALGSSYAFDSEKWHEKRQMLSHEAMRLKKAYRWAEKNATSPAQNVDIPLETHPNGSVKLVVSAKKAQIFITRDLIWAEDLQITQFKPDGKIESIVKAKKCVFDRNENARSGWVEGEAQIIHANTVFKGKNVYFSSIEEYVMAMDDSTVISSDHKMENLK